MELYPSELQVLTQLGLTLKQAKVYLALVKSETLKASEIAQASKVARPDVYRVISALRQLGLIEEVCKRPVEYRATPMNEALTFLLQTRTEQYKKVRAAAQMLLNRGTQVKRNEREQLESPQFILIPHGKQVIERVKAALERARSSVDLVLSWKRFSRGIANVFAESVEAAWAKNVKFRFILEVPPRNKTAEQLIKYCLKKPFCQIRFIPYYPRTVFGVYDRKEVFIIVFPEGDLHRSPALWSSNRSLVAMSEDYFEMLWPTAIES
ncbi:MAG: TrmB family transcriptional regulator [Candidatus Bathyarchaeales archaeon]